MDNHIQNKYIPNKKCFIYDPENQIAFFAEDATNNDKFIVSKMNIYLYVRQQPHKNNIPNLPIVESETNNILLLKSNLQKGIRRMNAKVSLPTTLALLEENPRELFHLLAIIIIEDICPIDSYPILIWFMLTTENYKLSILDKYIIVQIVNNLCNIKDYHEKQNSTKSVDWNPTLLEYKENSNITLSIYYFMEYKGTKKHSQLLTNTISSYTDIEIHNIPTTNWELPIQIYNKVIIINEAIDCYAFPEMVYYIQKKCAFGLPAIEIKNKINDIESCINIRKKYTSIMAEHEKQTNTWQIIKYHVADFRNEVIKYPHIYK